MSNFYCFRPERHHGRSLRKRAQEDFVSNFTKFSNTATLVIVQGAADNLRKAYQYMLRARQTSNIGYEKHELNIALSYIRMALDKAEQLERKDGRDEQAEIRK